MSSNWPVNNIKAIKCLRTIFEQFYGAGDHCVSIFGPTRFYCGGVFEYFFFSGVDREMRA